MKKAIFFAGIAAAALLAGCTKNEMAVNTEPETFTGDKAYLVVNLQDVGSASTKADDGGYKNGLASEYAINDANFYFYDSYGAYVTEAHISQPGGTYVGSTNIDYDTYTILTLTGLTGTNYPNWVVTVLNQPSDFSVAKTTIDDLYDLLSSTSTVGIDNGSSYLTMSTSSFVGADDNIYGYHTASSDPAYWYATPVKSTNFTPDTPTWDDTNKTYIDKETNTAVTPVDIYVERLAAKVIVKSGYEENSNYDSDTGRFAVEAETVAADGTVSTETYYIEFDGWVINATARQTYMMKHIESTSTWNDSYFGTTNSTYKFGTRWNDADNFRSYWCESYNYGQGTDYDSVSDISGNDDTYLKYTGFDGTLKNVIPAATDDSYGDYAYCAENTNTAGSGNKINRSNSSLLTTVLVKATAYATADATEGMTLVNLDGQLYTESNYLKLALSHLGVTYYLDEEGNTPMDESYLAISNISDGKVKVEVCTDFPEYVYTVEVDGEGNVTATPYEASDINALLDTHFNETFGADANGYNGGQMYYSVPLQHLNNDYEQTDGDGNAKILEANYGVVRNHIYYITVNDLTKFGTGIWDPTEIIVPGKEITTYALTTTIHVLSWKVVNWGVSF